MEWYCGNDWVYSSCGPDGSNGATCTCNTNYVYAEFELVGWNPTDSCEYIAGLCANDPNFDYGQASECRIIYEQTYSDQCYTDRECSRTATVAPGVTAVQRAWGYSSCDRYGVDSWMCNCNGGFTQSYVSFELPVDTDSSFVCPFAGQVCENQDAVVPVGTEECDVTYRTATASWCNFTVTCAREAAFGETALTINDSININCSEMDSAEQAWQCNCAMGSNYVDFAVVTEDNWETCSMVTDRCVQELAGGG